MNEQCRVLPLARPLVLVIKAVLEPRSPKRAYSTGLSSYAVFIMAVRFLRDREYQQRAEGTASVHASTLLLAVTRITEGVRYSLVVELWAGPTNAKDRFT